MRLPFDQPWVRKAAIAVALLATYGHLYEVALVAGESDWIARAWPITVYGLTYLAAGAGRPGRPWLALSLTVWVAAVAMALFQPWSASAGPIVSAWAPIALYGAHRLFISLRSDSSARVSSTTHLTPRCGDHIPAGPDPRVHGYTARYTERYTRAEVIERAPARVPALRALRPRSAL